MLENAQTIIAKSIKIFAFIASYIVEIQRYKAY